MAIIENFQITKAKLSDNFNIIFDDYENQGKYFLKDLPAH